MLKNQTSIQITLRKRMYLAQLLLVFLKHGGGPTAVMYFFFFFFANMHIIYCGEHNLHG